MKKVNITRCDKNPLLTVEDVKPSRSDMVVEGIFNCGATKYKDEYILLCRVAESVHTGDDNIVGIPVVKNNQGKIDFEVVKINKQEYPEYCFDDSRTITKGSDGNADVVYLTSLSHIRLARSKDGVNFQIDEKATIMPNDTDECWGIEDPRITKIEDTYYINYTAVSPNGAGTSLITTKDFETFERQGMIFLPENKDVAIFPEKINGQYVAFNRPVPRGIGNPDMWISKSDNLYHWGEHKHFLGVSDDGWDNGRIGGGTQPVMTSKGWLEIYHAADKNNEYCLGALLLDKEDPSKIIAKSKNPLVRAEEAYEKKGFFGNVVFACGCILEGENVIIYYGAADDKVCRLDISVEEIYKHLGI